MRLQIIPSVACRQWNFANSRWLASSFKFNKFQQNRSLSTTFSSWKSWSNWENSRKSHKTPLFMGGIMATTWTMWNERKTLHCEAMTVPTIFPYTLLDPSDVKPVLKAKEPRREYSNPIARFFLQILPESVKTMIRVVQLAFIFLPPLLTWPVAFFGRMVPERGNVKAGTLWWYDTLVHSMEMAGPTFIKLAQWAATRVDIFPPQLCAVLGRLQSEVKPHSFAQTRKIIREQFVADIEDLFCSFEDTPVGVGAIAQVYRARLKSEYAPEEVKKRYGSDEPMVAVKVLHPSVAGHIYRDLRIILFIARLIHLIPIFSSFNLPDQVSTFGEMMKQQLDLKKEAENIENFRAIWKDRNDVCFPEIIWPYVTEKALIESFEFGIPMKLFLKDGYTTVMDEWLATMGLDTLLTMLAVDNFVHTDLHPGNIMVTFVKPEKEDGFWKDLYRDLPEMFDGANLDAHPTIVVDKKNGKHHTHYDCRQLLKSLPPQNSPEFTKAFPEMVNNLAKQGYRPHLILLDCGLTATLRTNDLKNFLDLFRAVCEREGYRAGELMVERSRQPETCTDKDAFAREVDSIVKHVFGQTLQLQNIGIGDILTRVMNAVRKYRVQFEGDFVNIVVSIVLVEGIGRRLDPDLDLLDFAGKYLGEVEKRLEEVGEVSAEEKRKNMENLWKVKAATAYRGVGKKLGFGTRAEAGPDPGHMKIGGETIRLGS